MISKVVDEEIPRSREETKRETREALIAAGIEAFAEQGLDAPSLDAICARAGRTRGAFYVHFRDREDLVVQVMDRVIRAFVDAAIGDASAERGLIPTVHRFVGIVRALEQAIEQTGLPPAQAAAGFRTLTLQRALEACSRSDAVRARFVSVLEDAIERVAGEVTTEQRSGHVRTDVPPRDLATLLVAIAVGAGLALETGLRFDLQGASSALLALLAASKAS